MTPLLKSALHKVFKGQDDLLTKKEKVAIADEKARLHALVRDTDDLINSLKEQTDD